MTIDGLKEPGEAEVEHCTQKNIPETTFSYRGTMKYVFGLTMVKIPQKRKSTKPSRWVQMLPVSVWLQKMLLKQARKEDRGGLRPCSK